MRSVAQEADWPLPSSTVRVAVTVPAIGTMSAQSSAVGVTDRVTELQLSVEPVSRSFAPKVAAPDESSERSRVERHDGRGASLSATVRVAVHVAKLLLTSSTLNVAELEPM